MTNSRDELLPARTAFLFDLDGTLVDSVYQHVLAWREALEAAGINLAVWRIHRQIAYGHWSRWPFSLRGKLVAEKSVRLE